MMAYFVNVTGRDGTCRKYREPYQTLESALADISARYLTDFNEPYRRTGYFTLRAGEISRLLIRRVVVGDHLRQDIESIEIVSDRHFLEGAGCKPLPNERSAAAKSFPAKKRKH